MEKVKLPRNVADAFNAMFLSGEPVESAFRQIIRLNEYECCTKDAKVVFDYFNEKGFLLLAKAIIDGYEIEDDPITVTITAEMQENLRKFLRDQVQLENHTYIFAIKKAFEIVGIRIPGVND